MSSREVQFSIPARAVGEDAAVLDVLASGRLTGGGTVTVAAQKALAGLTGSPCVLLTTSATAALEMACLLLDIGPGDEVVLPSFTFSSCANAIALRGAVPVFVDIRPDTLNLDEALVEAAITGRTRAVMPMHYAGVAAEMDPIVDIARRHGIAVIEDAAQGICASYRGRALGTIGMFGAFSFHGSKNISCGEGGALLVNDESLAQRAEILWEKGTNRSRFIRGEVDKYTWIDVGSSFLPSEITAALLLAQLQDAENITARRRVAWERYHATLESLETEGLLERPIVPPHCEANGHIYGVLTRDAATRDAALAELNARGVRVTFHYVPLHSAPAGRRFGRVHGAMTVTDDLSARLLRLPIYADITAEDQRYVVECVRDVLSKLRIS